MRNMTIEELYEKLSSKEFQDVERGDMFYNFYLFQYDPTQEYQIREQIDMFKSNLSRPTTYIDVLALNLFDEFCKFLDSPLGNIASSQLQFYFDIDNNGEHDAVLDMLKVEASGRAFCEYIHNRIMEHINAESENKRPYIFLYGIGLMFPFLRTNVFLTNYEEFNKSSRYKVIVFYPGNSVGNSFSLLGCINDQHTYRAIKLIND